MGFAAAMTSSFAMTAKIFPNNVATVLVSGDSVLCDRHAVLAASITRRHKRLLLSLTCCRSHSLRRSGKELTSVHCALMVLKVPPYAKFTLPSFFFLLTIICVPSLSVNSPGVSLLDFSESVSSNSQVWNRSRAPFVTSQRAPLPLPCQ